MAPCVLFLLFFEFLFSSLPGVVSLTEPGDYAVLDEFRKGLLNPELLKWPIEDKDPCGNKWPHVFCSGSRVSQIQVQGLGLTGPLPQSFNKLSMLYNIGMQRNSFTGPLPSFSGLSGLQYAYLGYNKFDLIPLDFFNELTSLQVIALDSNPLNESTGWVLPKALENCAQLVNFSCSECNIVGPVPEFFGGFSLLSSLRLAYNSLTGEIPASFYGSNLQSLVLNNQYKDGMSGSIHILASMPSLVTVWLHGNSFTGSIPDNITSCASLAQLILNNNKLTGIVPVGLEEMAQLQIVKLDNNMFLGPIRTLKTQNYTYSNNPFCQEEPGLPCSEVVMALLDFLSGVNYPPDLTGSWKGNDPCDNWLGVSCIDGGVSVLNLPNRNLSGFISPSLGKIDTLREIRLSRNNLSGTIPANLTILRSLKTLDLTSNNLSPPVPGFPGSVKLLVDENPYIQNPNLQPPLTPNTPSGNFQAPPSGTSPSNGSSSPTSSPTKSTVSSRKVRSATKMVIIGASVAALVLIALLVVLRHHLHKDDKDEAKFITPRSVVVHPRDSSHQENMVKIAVTDNASRSIATSELRSVGSIGTPDTHFFDSGNLVISVQVLRDVTGNFDPENEVGRGGFGVVYKGELHDGTMVAVKRMEASVISNKALNEFQSEITVLSKVRHRNLVSLLGYSIEGSERLLVYEFIPQGALSKHIFHWKKLGMEPLSWMKRLNIALDVARGMEYLHTLAHQSFIHRDLKSSNILLDDDFRAKVADFGLVKLAPDGKNSVTTRLAGTFGYLAPEYAVTGKITTKADVFSFGVVLMELITGLIALDEDRPEETRYLASWFFDVKSSKEKFKAAIDPSIDLNDATLESILIIAELAGHCAAREPLQRPEMGHAVNVLAPLVEKWKPMKNDQEEYLGIDLHQPLLQMVKGWQADDDPDMSLTSLDDSKGSIPARPTGFAESFTSTDGR